MKRNPVTPRGSTDPLLATSLYTISICQSQNDYHRRSRRPSVQLLSSMVRRHIFGFCPFLHRISLPRPQKDAFGRSSHRRQRASKRPILLTLTPNLRIMICITVLQEGSRTKKKTPD